MRQGIVGIVVVCGVLTGCAAPNSNSWWEGWGTLASAGDEYQFDFAWELRGDEALAPLQVFSNAKQLWLQFASDMPIPTLFALRKGALVPLQAQQQGVYHVVDEKVEVLLLQRGAGQAWAYRTAYASALVHYLRQQQAMVAIRDSAVTTVSAASSPVSVAVVPAVGVAHESSPVQAHSVGDTTAVFTTSTSDHTLRQLLQRWASAAGWVFKDEHWTVTVDIPLSGPFTHSGGFSEAVQQLLLSTQLGDYPLQPCFYSNQVLRVVPLQGGCLGSAVESSMRIPSDGVQTAYPEQEVFVSLPWVAGRATNRTDDLAVQ